MRVCSDPSKFAIFDINIPVKVSDKRNVYPTMRNLIVAVWVILNFFVPFFSPARKINYFFRRRKINRYFSRRYLARILFSRRRKKSSIIFFAGEKNAGLLSRHVLGFTCLIPVALIARYLRNGAS